MTPARDSRNRKLRLYDLRGCFSQYPDASTVSAELRQQTPRVSHGRKAGQAAHAADAFSPKLSETISALDLVS
ncbi:hypothetical protein PInf_000476 [Phytophthora infestans]|nr:hypothetical protein PInf_000476 [Phytophthora infestans]